MLAEIVEKLEDKWMFLYVNFQLKFNRQNYARKIGERKSEPPSEPISNNYNIERHRTPKFYLLSC